MSTSKFINANNRTYYYSLKSVNCPDSETHRTMRDSNFIKPLLERSRWRRWGDKKGKIRRTNRRWQDYFDLNFQRREGGERRQELFVGAEIAKKTLDGSHPGVFSRLGNAGVPARAPWLREQRRLRIANCNLTFSSCAPLSLTLVLSLLATPRLSFILSSLIAFFFPLFLFVVGTSQEFLARDAKDLVKLTNLSLILYYTKAKGAAQWRCIKRLSSAENCYSVIR